MFIGDFFALCLGRSVFIFSGANDSLASDDPEVSHAANKMSIATPELICVRLPAISSAPTRRGEALPRRKPGKGRRPDKVNREPRELKH
jgi:hypothetical protein